MQRNYFRIYIFLCFLRLTTAFLIFISPFPIFILQIALDILDGINASRGGITRRYYHIIDKGLDLFWYVITFTYFLTQPQFSQAYSLFLGLLLWRALGYFLFLLHGKKVWFAICPNFYEQVAAILIVSTIPSLQFLITPGWWELSLVILFVIKIFQELALHFYEFSPTEKLLRMPMRWQE